jgi:hypothetical protein
MSRLGEDASADPIPSFVILRKSSSSAATVQWAEQIMVARGSYDLVDLGGGQSATGLLKLARRNRWAGIDVRPVSQFSDASQSQVGQRFRLPLDGFVTESDKRRDYDA